MRKVGELMFGVGKKEVGDVFPLTSFLFPSSFESFSLSRSFFSFFSYGLE